MSVSYFEMHQKFRWIEGQVIKKAEGNINEKI